MSSDSNALTYFLSLDELIQVIYQGSSRFVVISSVEESSWTVHLGLTGVEGRWWRGQWTDEDIRKRSGSSSASLEAYAGRLSNAFLQGQMHIGNWTTQRSTQVDFVLDTSTDTPARIPLIELPPESAASFAAELFTNIGIQAQSRKCRLNPSPFEHSGLATDLSKPSGSRNAPTASKVKAVEREAKDEIQVLKAELEKARGYSASASGNDASVANKKRKYGEERDIEDAHSSKTSRPLQKTSSVNETSKLVSIAKNSRGRPATTAPKGASLANPTRKARKYEALEFDSDED